MDRKELRQRKRRKRRIFFLFIWTLILFLLLSTTTYAWFTVNRVVSIDSLDIKVNVKGGLEISTDATNWKNTLVSTDIIGARDNYPGSINQLPSMLEPVSTGGELNNNHFLNMYYGLAQIINGHDYYSLNSTLQTDAEGNGDNSGKYMAFDVFLKLGTNNPIYLTTNSGTTIPDGVADNGIENAIRVAFVIQGHTGLESGVNTIQNLLNSTNDDVVIWEPNYDMHTTYGVNHALNIYNLTTSETNAERLPYDGIISEFGYKDDVSLSRATATNYPTYFKTVDVDIPTVNNFKNSVLVIPNGTMGFYKIRVYIWIEGQDVDCEDNASVGDVLFNIGFSTVVD